MKQTIGQIGNALHTVGMVDKWQNVKLMLVTHRVTIFIIVISLLLGRASMLEMISPFAAAFFASVIILRRPLAKWSALAMMIGALTAPAVSVGIVFLQLILVALLLRALASQQALRTPSAPWVVFTAVLCAGFFVETVFGRLDSYASMWIGVEALLAWVLTYIFLYAVPLLQGAVRTRTVRFDELLCLMILLAAVMTGAAGWLIGPLAAEHVISRYLLLLFAFAGGAALGASVGVVCGLVIGLADPQQMYQISVLAFSGLLAGLLREGRRTAVAAGLLLGSLILTVYATDRLEMWVSLTESAVAILLFFLTPRRWLQGLAQYVPGTAEHVRQHQEYARKLRDMTAQRVMQFSEVFQQLSVSFRPAADKVVSEQALTPMMERMAAQTCKGCWKKKQCWEELADKTHEVMAAVSRQVLEKPGLPSSEWPRHWREHCVRTEKLVAIARREAARTHEQLVTQRQMIESRSIVAEQLDGVAVVMADLAAEIRREAHTLGQQETDILEAVESLGLSIRNVDILSLEAGRIEIEILHSFRPGYEESRKLIAPLLSEIIGETVEVTVESELSGSQGVWRATFQSSKKFKVQVGAAYAAKGGDLLSGDSFSMMELDTGKYVLAISDGMGNGERAHRESRAALDVLQQLLRTGMEERIAIKSANSVLLLRSTDETYATVDLAMIDLYTAKTTFMKTGSIPSFIKRGGEVHAVMASNVPIGILDHIEVDLVEEELKSGDLLIMMTDGLYDAPGRQMNKERWMLRLIDEVETDDPQELADLLLERVIRHHHGEIADDMTVLVAKISKSKPEWATFRVPLSTKWNQSKSVGY